MNTGISFLVYVALSILRQFQTSNYQNIDFCDTLWICTILHLIYFNYFRYVSTENDKYSN